MDKEEEVMKQRRGAEAIIVPAIHIFKSGALVLIGSCEKRKSKNTVNFIMLKKPIRIRSIITISITLYMVNSKELYNGLGYK